MIKLIASDMDGTLLNSNHTIDKESIEAIKKAEERGIIFVIATGREYSGVKYLLDEKNIKCQCILSNGAEYRDEDGKIIDAINITSTIAEKVLKILEKNNMSARIFTSEGVYTNSSREEALKEVVARTLTFNPTMTEEEAIEKSKKEQFFINLKYVTSIDEFLNSKIEVRKFIAFHKDIDFVNKIKKEISEIKELAVSSSFIDNIEITDINAQKGIILEKVAKKIGLSNNEVLVLGDSYNDYSMFEIFEESVAMKNAIPEIKKIAKYITESNDDFGVAKAIYKAIENK